MWHTLSIDHISQQLQTDPAIGITTEEAARRLKEHGPNRLPAAKTPPLIIKFLLQFKNLFVIILLIAAAISFHIGETIDAIVITGIMIINAIIGFIQEIQAESSLKSLQSSDITNTTVLRSQTVTTIPVTDVVPGDIILLEEGEKVPADARILEAISLQVDESILTGESQLIIKHTSLLPDTVQAIGDRTNMVHKDTTVQMGRGKALVVATGIQTEVGKIAQALTETTAEKTPLTRELDHTARTLTILIGIIAVGLFLINILQHQTFSESLLVAIAIAVAAIPEGLPTIVTIVLSLGVTRLAKKKTIVKKLMAVETLGAIQIIGTDKTGTITQNKISVVAIHTPGNPPITVEGEGYLPHGTFFDEHNTPIPEPQKNTILMTLLQAGVLASNATLTTDHLIIGDTTEGALLVAARRAGLSLAESQKKYPRVSENPFTSDRKMMSVVIKDTLTQEHILYAKGAPEVILHRCRIDATQKDAILQAAATAAAQGLRNLAIAYKKISLNQGNGPQTSSLIDEQDLEYIGFVSMQDPLRAEVAGAIAAARHAGIRTIMITGDHKDTARSIAKDAGIITDPTAMVLTQHDIDQLTDGQLIATIQQNTSVFARIAPLGKLRLVNCIKSIPHTQIAVTGDGVNDAPALKAAHIGIAMGRTGTDITREVAAMIITDDNYATIITAIAEGRVIFANLVKAIRYLISCNISEVIVVTLGVLAGFPTLLSPIQILWINLITDGFPALALGMEPAETQHMQRPPRDISQGILPRKRWYSMIIEGSVIGVSTFLLFLYAVQHYSFPVAQTLAFTTLGFSQLVHAFNNRSTRQSLFQMGVFSNPSLIAAAGLSIVSQLLVLNTPWGNHLFGTVPLSGEQWFLIIACCLVPLIFVEAKKSLSRTQSP